MADEWRPIRRTRTYKSRGAPPKRADERRQLARKIRAFCEFIDLRGEGGLPMAESLNASTYREQFDGLLRFLFGVDTFGEGMWWHDNVLESKFIRVMVFLASDGKVDMSDKDAVRIFFKTGKTSNSRWCVNEEELNAYGVTKEMFSSLFKEIPVKIPHPSVAALEKCSAAQEYSNFRDVQSRKKPTGRPKKEKVPEPELEASRRDAADWPWRAAEVESDLDSDGDDPMGVLQAAMLSEGIISETFDLNGGAASGGGRGDGQAPQKHYNARVERDAEEEDVDGDEDEDEDEEEMEEGAEDEDDDAETKMSQLSIGSRLEVYWPGELQWFAGQVTEIRRRSGIVRIHYDDGEVWDTQLMDGTVTWRLLKARPSPGKRRRRNPPNYNYADFLKFRRNKKRALSEEADEEAWKLEKRNIKRSRREGTADAVDTPASGAAAKKESAAVDLGASGRHILEGNEADEAEQRVFEQGRHLEGRVAHWLDSSKGEWVLGEIGNQIAGAESSGAEGASDGPTAAATMYLFHRLDGGLERLYFARERARLLHPKVMPRLPLPKPETIEPAGLSNSLLLGQEYLATMLRTGLLEDSSAAPDRSGLRWEILQSAKSPPVGTPLPPPSTTGLGTTADESETSKERRRALELLRDRLGQVRVASTVDALSASVARRSTRAYDWRETAVMTLSHEELRAYGRPTRKLLAALTFQVMLPPPLPANVAPPEKPLHIVEVSFASVADSEDGCGHLRALMHALEAALEPLGRSLVVVAATPALARQVWCRPSVGYSFEPLRNLLGEVLVDGLLFRPWGDTVFVAKFVEGSSTSGDGASRGQTAAEAAAKNAPASSSASQQAPAWAASARPVPIAPGSELEPNVACAEGVAETIMLSGTTYVRRCLGNGAGLDLPHAVPYRVEVFATANGRGLGVRAIQRIPAHSPLLEYVGELISYGESARRDELRHDTVDRYLWQLQNENPGPSAIIDASTFGNASRFINHSCDPNCVAKPIQRTTKGTCGVPAPPRIVITTTRIIEAGQEITYDYNALMGAVYSNLKCLCGARTCRGTIY
mmetsp:Transcript_24571/g.80241  ORF Transcript_24571/g.80241 Transcript_24571/m.80241 type:complete len:1052 (+) Transcript_24571:316-3471(+)